jgi:nitrile hydratase subunit alpha
MSRMTAPAEADIPAASRPAPDSRRTPTRIRAERRTDTTLVVCTLWSYRWAVLRLAPRYKSAPYRSHAVRDPRVVLVELGGDVEVHS